jgi:succinate-semialdehyde dehydrogenase/glutarate-semialdehyde dehydrogenase
VSIASINPATGEQRATHVELTSGQIHERIEKGWAAFLVHRETRMDERAAAMTRVASLLDSEKADLAALMTSEMGKPIGAAVAEVEKCAWVCRYYAEHAAAFLADEEVATDAERSWVRYEPIGPVLAVMPWNFPFWQVFRFAAPAIMAGNVGLLKHASNVPACALAIEDLFVRAGFADGVFQALLIGSGAVAEVIDHPRVRAATLTGSTPAGSAVAERAGKRIKKTVLELGGSDPFIVLPTADFDAAVATAVKARIINNGQSCIAAKRFIVHSAVYDEFERRFVQQMEALRVGDPTDPGTDVGPLATAAIREEVHAQVEASVAGGARLLTGGQMIEGSGFYYPPTVLADIPPTVPAYREEVFGPVALLFRVADADEALRVANDVPFGLGSSVWTTDEAEERKFIEGLEAGQVFVNGMVASDPRLPFGGVKGSGYGRELGIWGIREFVNVKTVWVGKRQAATE